MGITMEDLSNQSTSITMSKNEYVLLHSLLSMALREGECKGYENLRNALQQKIDTLVGYYD